MKSDLYWIIQKQIDSLVRHIFFLPVQRFFIALLLFSGMFLTIQLNAQSLDIELLSGSQFLSIKNPVKNGPEAIYISFQVCNNTLLTQNGLTASLEDFEGNNFQLAGDQAESQLIGKLTPGACKILYWYVQFDADIKNETYTHNMYVYQDGAPISMEPFQYTVERTLETSAGGHIMDVVVGGGTVVGSLTELEVEYSFGNVKKGTELIFQPAGNLDFDAKSYQLVGTEILYSDIPTLAVGDQGKLYYVSEQQVAGTDHLVRVKYLFKNSYTGPGCEAKPFAAMISGNVYKMTNNYGSAEFQAIYPPPTHGLTILSSSSTTSALPGDRVTFDVSIINESVETVSLDKIENTLPEQFVLVSFSSESEIDLNNTAELPLYGSTGTLTFIPVESSETYGYTSYTMEPADTLTLSFEAEISTKTYEGDFTNTVQAMVSETTTAESSTTLCIGNYPCTLDASWDHLSVSQRENVALIEWSLSGMGDGGQFEVLRSTDGVKTEVVSKIDRNELANFRYTLMDTKIAQMNEKAILYRIKYIDNNGKSGYSEWVNLAVDRSKSFVSLSPNPVQDRIAINYNPSTNLPVSIIIHSSTGLEKFKANMPSAGFAELNLNTKDWPAGIYYLEVNEGGERMVKSFIKI